MPKPKRPVRPGPAQPCAKSTPAEGFTPEKRRIFLAHLAQTSNVAASARKAKVSSGAVYRERIRSAAFRDRWRVALAEGYARLEAELLAEALRPASGRASDRTLRSRAMKLRVGMGLLSAHRASVRGEAPPAPSARPGKKAKDVLRERFALMRRRTGPGNGDAAPGEGDAQRG